MSTNLLQTFHQVTDRSCVTFSSRGSYSHFTMISSNSKSNCFNNIGLTTDPDFVKSDVFFMARVCEDLTHQNKLYCLSFCVNIEIIPYFINLKEEKQTGPCMIESWFLTIQNIFHIYKVYVGTNKLRFNRLQWLWPNKPHQSMHGASTVHTRCLTVLGVLLSVTAIKGQN